VDEVKELNSSNLLENFEEKSLMKFKELHYIRRKSRTRKNPMIKRLFSLVTKEKILGKSL